MAKLAIGVGSSLAEPANYSPQMPPCREALIAYIEGQHIRSDYLIALLFQSLGYHNAKDTTTSILALRLNHIEKLGST